MQPTLRCRPCRPATADPRRLLRLRRRDPLEPVRGVQRVRGAQRPPPRLHPHDQRHQPGRERLGALRAQRGHLRRVLRPVRGGVPRPGSRGRGAGADAAAGRRDPPGDGRSGAPLPRAARHGVPHQQLGELRRLPRRCPGRRSRRRPRPVPPRDREQQGRRAEARPALLRAGLRDARGGARGGRVPRRPRREPQAGRRHGHDHDQGGRPGATRSPTSKRWWASLCAEACCGRRLLDEHRRAEEDGLLLGVDGVRPAGRAPGLGPRHAVDLVACRRSARRAGPSRSSTHPCSPAPPGATRSRWRSGSGPRSRRAGRRATGRAARPGPPPPARRARRARRARPG